MNIESTGGKKSSRKTFRKCKSKDEQRKSRPVRVPNRKLRVDQPACDNIAKYCCFLQNLKAHGIGFIVKLEDLPSCDQKWLLIVDWKKQGKKGERAETDYVLITSHNTLSGSLSALKGWTVSWQGIADGHRQTKKSLSDLVCGVISCCGPESLFAIRHGDTKIFCAHPNASCQMRLNVAILFLNKKFEELLKGAQVSPPVVSVQEYLAHPREYRQIISSQKDIEPYRVCYYNGDGRSPQLLTAAISVIEQQDTSVREGVLNKEIRKYEKLQKLCYSMRLEVSSSMQPTSLRKYYGSPVVYHDPDTNECSIIGVHVGETEREGEFFAVTLHGILQLIQGGLVPVMTLLRCLEAPRAWVSRWGYLVTPHIDKLTSMDCSYLCDVLHYLLKEKFGIPLVKLSVDLVDVDNEAALDLLCALFKHFEAADHAEIYDECLRRGIEHDIKQLCKSLLNLLAAAVEHSNRTSLVEKCCNFYNGLLNIKFAGLTEEVLCTSENLELMKIVCQKYKFSDAIQENTMNIFVKCFHSLENQHKEVCEEKHQQKLELHRVQREVIEKEEQLSHCKRKLERAEQDLIMKKQRLDLLSSDSILQ